MEVNVKIVEIMNYENFFLQYILFTIKNLFFGFFDFSGMSSWY